MAGKEIWFGTREQMAWVPAPEANHATNIAAWREVDYFLSGGAGVRRSAATRKELDWSWSVQAAERLAPLIAALQRQGPYYLMEPIAARTNAVPSYWATPTLDGPPLIPGAQMFPASGGDTSQGYSRDRVQYVVSKATNTNLELPVPPGYTLHIGVHGTGTASWSWVSGAGTGSMLSPTTTTRTNLTYVGPGIAQLKAPAGTYHISGIVAQVLPNGETPDKGPFLPGLGNSPMELRDNPSITNYSAVIPNAQIGIAATFVEVGAWQ